MTEQKQFMMIIECKLVWLPHYGIFKCLHSNEMHSSQSATTFEAPHDHIH